MENQTILLKYGDRGFGVCAKKLLNQDKDFSVLICGWRARIILSSLQLLMHMQENDKKSYSKLSTYYSVTRFLLLLFLSPFMSIFWLAVANNKWMHIQRSDKDLVELRFSAKSTENS